MVYICVVHLAMPRLLCMHTNNALRMLQCICQCRIPIEVLTLPSCLGEATLPTVATNLTSKEKLYPGCRFGKLARRRYAIDGVSGLTKAETNSAKALRDANAKTIDAATGSANLVAIPAKASAKASTECGCRHPWGPQRSATTAIYKQMLRNCPIPKC